ncbi:MAG TPA: peptidylprolyl isomerase, partial [Candidatus Thermoplasmatota archaeon]|nr:peptidylprolyl isomerase [Candidatus Thermoplasmatota archaeon]
ALKDGDVVRFDYILHGDGVAKPVDTSMEPTARQHGIHREGKRYRPLTVTLGAEQVLPALERHMREKATVGKTFQVELDAKEGYGERDPKKIKDVPMAQFRSQKVAPEPGMELNLGGQRGVVTRVAGGRVRVDLNHDLAGKRLRYEYTLREVLTDEKAKIQAVLDNLFPQGGTKFETGKDAVTLDVPDAAKFDQNWMMAKFRVVAELRAATGKAKAIRLVENFPVMPDPPAEEPGHEGHGHGPGGHKH